MSRLAKLIINHESIKKILNLPEDCKVTSMHTVRGEDNTGVYIECERFDELSSGDTAPEFTMKEIENKGLWDSENNR
jgi:hypothetical protein